MKNYIILMIIVIIAVTSIAYLYFNYQKNNSQMKANNKEYNNLYNKEINGNTLATIINKAIDQNTKNEVAKDENEYYINNGTNSIIIEIKFTESDSVFKSEKIAQRGIAEFIRLYSNLKFKCTKIEYHTKNNFVSYLYFQQI